MFPAPAGGVRLADAVRVYLGTISMANTRETYAALDRLEVQQEYGLTAFERRGGSINGSASAILLDVQGADVQGQGQFRHAGERLCTSVCG